VQHEQSNAEARAQVLAKARRIVVKVGSAVLTTREGLNLAIVDSLASQLSALMDRGLTMAFVSSGAVASGRGVLRAMAQDRADARGMPDRQAASAIGQSRLMHAYDEAFAKRGKITAQVLLTRDDFRNRARFLNVCNTFDALFSWGVLPIVNENDTVAVQELEFGDNDRLAALLLNLVEADLFVNLTSAGGVFTANPDLNEGAQRVSCIENIDKLDLAAMCGGKTNVGSGGMYSKLLSARRAALRGAPTLILAGREPDCIVRAFAGEDLGTWVAAKSKPISRRKFRLAFNTEPAGLIRVDTGAVRALTSGGKSLLAAGITAVEGSFARGALVRVMGPDQRAVALGLSNYRAADLRTIAGKKCSEIEDALGYCYNEAIHRDNMLLDSAV
jgi:glutamate 5-kinase